MILKSFILLGFRGLRYTKALGDIARAKGMTQIARETGLSRDSLYKALSGDRSPNFHTVFKVASALGIKLSASPIEAAEPV
jgi:probable addiction module antidote protein